MISSFLRITNGTVTKNFSTGDSMKLMEYKPVIVAAFGNYIEEQIRLGFVGSPAINNSNFHQINLLFEQARNYHATETGPRVYLEFDPDNSGTYYRSQLINGYIELSTDIAGNPPKTSFLYVVLHISRGPFWEGALTQIPLNNGSASDNTTGITINNSSRQIVGDPGMEWDDGTPILWDDDTEIDWDVVDATGLENFVDVRADDLLGDLPAPIKIEIENTKSGSDETKELYLWHNVYSNPAAFTHMLEAEAASGGTVTPSGTDTTSQGDQYATLAWTATVETLIASWTLNNVIVTNAAGGRFAVIARWRGTFPYTNCWIRLKLLTANDNVLWKGNLSIISSTRELALLDTLRLPPYLANQSSIKDVKLQMFGLRNQSGTHSIDLDYLQFSPLSGDGGWKRFISVDDGIAYQEKFVHDDIEGFDYRIDTGSQLISEYSAYGGPILLVPNKDQRLYINSCDKNGHAKIDQTMKIKLWYRPRRSAL